MALVESLTNPVAVELLDGPSCLELSQPINDFENAVFGPDFYCDFESVRHWVESGDLFYAAVAGEVVAGFPKVFSVMSILITSEASQQRLWRGEIADYELMPWSLCPPGSRPVAYFASVISDNPQHLAALYESLGADVEHYLRTRNLQVESGFTIAAGPAGLRHLTRNGFSLVPDRKYHGKYDLLVIDAWTASTDFWRSLLRPRLICLQPPAEPGEASEPPPPPAVPPPEIEDARTVESRLALSKAERYRALKCS